MYHKPETLGLSPYRKQQIETLAVYFSERICSNHGLLSSTVILRHVCVMQSWTMQEQLSLLLLRGYQAFMTCCSQEKTFRQNLQWRALSAVMGLPDKLGVSFDPFILPFKKTCRFHFRRQKTIWNSLQTPRLFVAFFPPPRFMFWIEENWDKNKRGKKKKRDMRDLN